MRENYFRSMNGNGNDDLDWIRDSICYPDITDIIEQEEKEKKAKKAKRASRKAIGYSDAMDITNIRARMCLGRYVSRDELSYLLQHGTSFEISEMTQFLLNTEGGLSALAYCCQSDRGLDHGYSEGFTSKVIEMNGKNTLVMIPTATPDLNNDIESTSRVHNVLEVLQENFHEDFDEVMQRVTERHSTDISEALGIKDYVSVHFVKCCSKHVESSWDQPLDDFKVDVIVNAEFVIRIPVERYCEQYSMPIYQDVHKHLDYRLRYTLDLISEEKTCSIPVAAPVKQFPADSITKQREWNATAILRLHMKKKEYPKYAARMLRDVYPEALEEPTEIDGELLVDRLSGHLGRRYQRMKLRLRKEHLGNEGGIKGRIFFADMMIEDAWGEPIAFEAGDIVINLDEIRHPSDLLATIIHECVHVYFDLAFFMLQLMAGVPCYNFIDRSAKWLKSHKNAVSSVTSTLIEEMEKQTESLTAYVMMEENHFRSECQRLFEITSYDESPAALLWMMEQLSGEFGSSMQMTKIRMKETGIQKAEGVWNFIGEKIRVPDHASGEEWEPGVVYTIDRPDALALFNSSEQFAQALLSGKYVYIMGSYVLDAPKYVESVAGHDSLTDYALTHMKECCLSFRMQSTHTPVAYVCGTAARAKKQRNPDKYLTRHILNSEPDSEKAKRERTVFANDANDWAALADSLHGTFKEALQTVLDTLGITQGQLSEELGVARNTLLKWIGREFILKRHVIGICLALHVRPVVSMRLIELAPHRLGYHGADALYIQLLCDSDATVESGSLVLEQEGYKRLNAGEQKKREGLNSGKETIYESDLIDFDFDTQQKMRKVYNVLP